MEEQVGELWHKLISRLADSQFPEAQVELREVERTVSIIFRALGGDAGLQITTAEASDQNTKRSWLKRIAGSDEKVTLAWRDESYLRMPPSIAWFPERSLNRDLYVWLAALAVGDVGTENNWFLKNQQLTQKTLREFPGLKARYQRLLDAHLALRPDPAKLKGNDAKMEQAIQQALRSPGSVEVMPPWGRKDPQPVPLWLHPFPPLPTKDNSKAGESENDEREEQGQQKTAEQLRRQAERVQEPESDRGLITVRMENIFTWGEFLNIDRGSEDEDDLDRAEAVARDIDRIAVSRDGKQAAAKLKFDLDLPGEADDDLVLNEGILLPEWDWKKQQLIPDHCRIQPMMNIEAPPCELPEHLLRTAKKLRNQFQALAPARVWHRAQPDGQEVDLDAYLRYATDRAAGQGTGADALYKDMRSGARDLACLLLADLSLSTDTWVNDYHRVIDVIRDSLYLFSESLSATGDRFGMYGFSSRKRDPVRVHTLKDFDERYSGEVRGRLQAIKPGYYTRMGAAIRYSTKQLAEQPAGRRLLLILTDGKPNDLDKYEGRYGLEDTRQAVAEARRLGLQPFCVTIDEKGNDYLPHLFGTGGYVVIRHPAQLPKELPLLYAQLTA